MLIDKLLSFLVPFECLNCGSEGRLLCFSCTPLLVALPERCYRCRKISSGSKTCASCRSSSLLRYVYVVCVYEGISKELIWRLKYKSMRAVAKEMAEHMALKLPSKSFVIVPVPTTTNRARQRGYDQAKLIARELARSTGYEYADIIARHGKVHQVGASRSQRKKQLVDVFRVKRPDLIADQDILLIDDVLTTGSTLESAARAIKSSGAKSVSAAIFAQTE